MLYHKLLINNAHVCTILRSCGLCCEKTTHSTEMGGPTVQAHYSTLLRLKQYFPFSLIDAMGSLEECKAQIARELRYQSSLDLDEATYSAIR